MLRMNSVQFNVEDLDLVTKKEKSYHNKYLEKLIGYADGKVDGVLIKNMTAGAAVIAKKQQSRSAMAVLNYNVLSNRNRSESLVEIEDKSK